MIGAPTSVRSFPSALHRAVLGAGFGGVVLLGMIGASFAQDPGRTADRVIARVNGIDIRESDLRIAEEDAGRSVASYDDAAKRDYLVKYVSDLVILSQLAAEQNVADEIELQRRMTFVRNKALSEKLLQVTAQNAATDDAARAAYDEAVRKSPPQPELRLRSIVIRFTDENDPAAIKAAEAKANEALRRIAKGEDFATVAAALSDNPGAKTNGGDLGYQTRDEMGKEYAAVAFGLKQGAVSPLIRTSFGWHIIKLDDQRLRKPIAFEAVRVRFRELVGNRAQADLVAKLRSEAQIETLDGTPTGKTDGAAK